MFNFGKKDRSGEQAPMVDPVDEDFKPTAGSFFRTLEYPLTDSDGHKSGKTWMEAGLDAKSGKWVLWQKSISNMEDILLGGNVNTLNATVLFEKTSFTEAYNYMATFEKSQAALETNPLETKTPAKLGGDYYRQFAWREGLMMSRSGRLYPMPDENKVMGANFFDEKDFAARKVFLERIKTEKFIPVAIELPSVDWKKAYAADKTQTDARLNLLKARYGGDLNNFELALQVIGQEKPEVFYAYLQTGFSPKTFQDKPEQHFALVQAAIDRTNVEVLNLLSEAGMSFFVRVNGKTPLESVLDSRRYSHLHVMLMRDGAKIANYADENGTLPAMVSIVHQDMQAFRMLYLEGLAYDKVDENGWSLLHYACASSFLPGVYAWLDEGLSIDAPIKGTDLTGLSIARRQNDQALIDFMLKHGANPAAPSFETPAGDTTKSAEPAATPSKPVVEFSVDMLNTAATNDEITAAAKAFVEAGGVLNMLSAKGVSVYELCWKNQKSKPELDRRALIPVFAQLGVDVSVQLTDGTTTLNRVAGAASFDLAFFKAVAPSVKDPNAADANGNNVIHALQMNANELASHSNNVSALLKLFPKFDVNAQNNEGFSNVGLAVRLNRSQTLKLFAPLGADLSLEATSGWSYLDIAFTTAPWALKVTGAPRADKMSAGNETLRGVVLDMVERATPQQKESLLNSLKRDRPDGKNLPSAMKDDKVPDAMINRLVQAFPSGPVAIVLKKKPTP